MKFYCNEVEQIVLRLQVENPTWDVETLFYETMEEIQDNLDDDYLMIERHLKRFWNSRRIDNIKSLSDGNK